MKAIGTVTIQATEGPVDVPFYRKMSKKVGDREVVFVLSLHHGDKKTLVVSEESTGLDTHIRLIHPVHRIPVQLTHVSAKGLDTGKLRNMFRCAVHNALARLGHERFLNALDNAQNKGEEPKNANS